MKRGLLIGIGVVLILVAVAGWTYGFVTIGGLGDEVSSRESDLQGSRDTAVALEATRDSLGISLGTAEALIIQGEERQATLESRLTEEVRAGMEAVSELLSLEAMTECQGLSSQPSIDYASNSAVSDDLQEWLGDVGGTIDTADWEIIWTNSPAAIHRLYGEYLYVFIVSFENTTLGTADSVFWVDRWCFLDR
jgi:hypothetical protein